MALASSTGVIGLCLASHYPVLPWAMCTLFGLACAAFFRFPRAWLVVIPMLVPLIGLAPWTGWITFEELDILVLAAATGGYARLASFGVREENSVRSRSAGAQSAGMVAGLALVLFTLSLVSSLVRGFDDAGGFEFSWYGGYYDAVNSIRLAKPFLLALLVWPLVNDAFREAPQLNGGRWSLGLSLGLVGVALATVWERIAFTDLLNFSTDYRTTALFWEMHVGGAALDGFLALTVPFGVRELATAKTPWRWALGAIAVLLGGYACLTTFSRGVYLAVPVALFLLLWLQSAQKRRIGTEALGARSGRDLVSGSLLVIAFCLSAAFLFPTSGYRGLFALFGATAVLLPLAGKLHRSTLAHAVLAVGVGLALSGVAAAVAVWFAKGAYVSYAISATASAGLAYWPDRRAQRQASNAMIVLGFASFICTLACVCLICAHWGGHEGMRSTVPIVSGMLVLALASVGSKRDMWPESVRWQGAALSTMLVAASVIAVVDGGSYMSFRFSTSSQDLDGRLRHWRESFQAQKTYGDWLLGKGLGRFPASQLLVGADEGRPGDYRLAAQNGNGYLVLAGGRQESGWGDMLRVSQRVSVPTGTTTVMFDIRADSAVSLHLEVCEKHLLYNGACLFTEVPVAARPGEWQVVTAVLKGDALSRGAWYAPRLVAFSLGITSPTARADIDNLSLRDASGRELLSNGDFSQGLARWFFTSDRSHLPWHVKNLPLHVLFEQGAVAVVLLSILLAGSLWRLVVGNARDHALAPATAAALIGFTLVGMFDSLLDVPRIAFLFYVLLLVGLSTRGPPRLAR